MLKKTTDLAEGDVTGVLEWAERNNVIIGRRVRHTVSSCNELDYFMCTFDHFFHFFPPIRSTSKDDTFA